MMSFFSFALLNESLNDVQGKGNKNQHTLTIFSAKASFFHSHRKTNSFLSFVRRIYISSGSQLWDICMDVSNWLMLKFRSRYVIAKTAQSMELDASVVTILWYKYHAHSFSFTAFAIFICVQWLSISSRTIKNYYFISWPHFYTSKYFYILMINAWTTFIHTHYSNVAFYYQRCEFCNEIYIFQKRCDVFAQFLHLIIFLWTAFGAILFHGNTLKVLLT